MTKSHSIYRPHSYALNKMDVERMTHVKFLVDRLPDGFREIQEILEALLGEGSLNPCDIVLLEGALKTLNQGLGPEPFEELRRLKILK